MTDLYYSIWTALRENLRRPKDRIKKLQQEVNWQNKVREGLLRNITGEGKGELEKIMDMNNNCMGATFTSDRRKDDRDVLIADTDLVEAFDFDFTQDYSSVQMRKIKDACLPGAHVRTVFYLTKQGARRAEKYAIKHAEGDSSQMQSWGKSSTRKEVKKDAKYRIKNQKLYQCIINKRRVEIKAADRVICIYTKAPQFKYIRGNLTLPEERVQKLRSPEFRQLNKWVWKTTLKQNDYLGKIVKYDKEIIKKILA